MGGLRRTPCFSPEKVLDYLGRYTQRVALSNNRILAVAESVEGSLVTFSYRDRRNGNSTRRMPLQAHEFMRRFLLHVLPNGFMRIRHFGFLANRSRKQKLDRCRLLLGLAQQPSPAPKKSARYLDLRPLPSPLAASHSLAHASTPSRKQRSPALIPTELPTPSAPLWSPLPSSLQSL
jgi:hypothetical protein